MKTFSILLQIQNFKAKVILKDNAIPKFLKARPLLFAVRDKVDAELDQMEKSGVIEKIDQSEWASPLVVVPKPNGKVRITGDFKNTVNSQLCITQYPLAVPEELFSQVSGGNKFSKLDGTNAYHQIELEESCKAFLVINTHRGLYRYNVLPQGISSSPAIFQEFMDKLLKGIPMTRSYIDDCISSGNTDQQHLEGFKIILQRMRESNYKLSRDKCSFMVDKVEFLGHVISRKGIHTSSKTVHAIQAIQQPESVTELKSFLGLINFYCKFVPSLGEICSPLYHLTKSDVQWGWSKQCQKAFDQVKLKLTTSPVLAHFNPSLPIGISCDASPKGLGVVLFHRYPDSSEQPIAYASKVLSEAEQRYPQIEKEGLSIVFGLKKFYKYLCGRNFILITDHQPLLTIFGPKSHLKSYTANRLHHWSLYLSEFQYSIEYRRTTEHGNADALSRFPLEDCGVPSEVESIINLLVEESLDVLPVTASSIKKATARDPVLSQVFQYTTSGWPSHFNDSEVLLKPYYIRRVELTIVQGVLMWGIRVLVPASLRNKLLHELHESHQGIVRMKSIARQFMWWPKIDADIEELGKSCVRCSQTHSDPPTAPLHPWKSPDQPSQRIHIDQAGPFLGKVWLVIMDAHSKWPEVFCLNQNSSSTNIIQKLLEVIARFGIPLQIVSDNGSQFTSAEFKRFCTGNGIRHTTSSVYHPRSNGEAERFVQTFKNTMKRAEGQEDIRLQKFLMEYRITPHATTGSAPCELLQKRKIRTKYDLIRPDVPSQVWTSQKRQEKSFNNNKLRLFQIGEEVWVKTFSKNEEKWSFGKVTRILGPVTYVVNVGAKLIKRHVDQIRVAVSNRFLNKDDGDDDLNQEADDPMVTPSNSPISEQSTPIPVVPSPDQSNTTVPSLDEGHASNTSVGGRPRRNPKQIQRYGVI